MELEHAKSVHVVQEAGYTVILVILAILLFYLLLLALLLLLLCCCRNQYGQTALMLASFGCPSGVVKLLLEMGVPRDTGDKDGFTALMLASAKSRSDVVKLLLEKGATVDTATKKGGTALMCASGRGHSDVVKLLLEKGATVDTVDKNGHTALSLASVKGHSDVVKLLLEKGATVDTVYHDTGRTALTGASVEGHSDVVKLLLEKGANISHVDCNSETAAMYIIFTLIAKHCYGQYDASLIESVRQAIQDPIFPKSHYCMCNASFALMGALLCNTNSEWFDSHFAKSTLQEDPLYAFLPANLLRHCTNFIIQGIESNEHLFLPYQGVEGKICLHTLATAVVCKLPNTALQWLTPQHRDKLVNMLGQTPLHLLAMYGGSADDMEEKILLLTETVGFSFSDRDNNGRAPYHIACLCFNHQFLLCGRKLDFNCGMNILIQDNLDKTPTSLLFYAVNSSEIPLENLSSAKKTLDVLQQIIGTDLMRNTQQKSCTSYSTSNHAISSLKECFKDKKTAQELSKMTNMAKDISFDTDDIAWLFKCRSRGIVSLTDYQHIHAVINVIHLLKLIGSEMGKIDPLFECEPDLKGSIREYTKCGELDELDTSMKLVNFTDNFSINIAKNGTELYASITSPTEPSPYWSTDRFFSVLYCADFWQISLKALNAEATSSYSKGNGLIIENCERRHGFVGMLNISCRIGDSIQLISVDIARSIVGGHLKAYTALLRPRNHDNEEVGSTYYHGLELSSSHKDWDFLKFLQPEVMCGYALVKMLRSMAGPFQTDKGRKYTAEDILPSYMVKMALLWILDPENKRSEIYKDVKIDSVFDHETSSGFEADVVGVCQEILLEPHVSGAKGVWLSLKEHLLKKSHVSGLDFSDRHMVFKIYKKCAAGNRVLTATERILPYVMATMYSDKQNQNGINLEWIEENLNPDILHQYEIIDSRNFYTETEAEGARIQHSSENKANGQLSHHKLSYPDISEETARKCRVWALRMVQLLPLLLKYNGRTDERDQITGVRNYYLPHQEIYAKDKDLAVALCKVVEAVLE